jgi:hypothetical protein
MGDSLDFIDPKLSAQDKVFDLIREIIQEKE